MKKPAQRRAKILVRRLGSGEAEELIALERASFSDCDQFPARTWRHLTHSASALILATRNGPVLGSAIVWLTRRTCSVARMYSLAVHPDCRGQGLARALVAASLAHLPRRFTTLSLEVRVNNVPALRLYESLGFIVSNHLMGYYPDGGDGLRMRAPRAAVAAALAG